MVVTVQVKKWLFLLPAGVMCMLAVTAQQTGTDRAGLEAAAMAEVIAARYQGNINKDSLYTILYNKAQAVERVWKEETDPVKQKVALTAVMQQYDSLVTRQTLKAQASAYVNEQLAVMDKIKPLPEKERRYIHAFFLHNYLRSPAQGLADLFVTAMRGIVRDTIYYSQVFKADIDRKASVGAYEFYAANKKKISAEVYKNIRPVVYQKWRALALIDYVAPMNSKLNEDMKEPVIARFDRSVDSLLIRCGVFMRDSRFATAIRYKKELELKEWQVDSLLDKAATMDAMIESYKAANPIGNFDTKQYQVEQVLHILTRFQHELFLNCRNRELALFTAKKDWERLVKAGVDTGLDSAKTVGDLYTYELRKFVANERCSISDILANRMIKKEVEESKPMLLVQLDAAVKGSEESKKLKKALAW